MSDAVTRWLDCAARAADRRRRAVAAIVVGGAVTGIALALTVPALPLAAIGGGAAVAGAALTRRRPTSHAADFLDFRLNLPQTLGTLARLDAGRRALLAMPQRLPLDRRPPTPPWPRKRIGLAIAWCGLGLLLGRGEALAERAASVARAAPPGEVVRGDRIGATDPPTPTPVRRSGEALTTPHNAGAAAADAGASVPGGAVGTPSRDPAGAASATGPTGPAVDQADAPAASPASPASSAGPAGSSTLGLGENPAVATRAVPANDAMSGVDRPPAAEAAAVAHHDRQPRGHYRSSASDLPVRYRDVARRFFADPGD